MRVRRIVAVLAATALASAGMVAASATPSFAAAEP